MNNYTVVRIKGYCSFIVTCYLLLFSCQPPQENGRPDQNVAPAYGVLQRLIGERAHELSLTLQDAAGEREQVTIKAANGRVAISGNSLTALCFGAYTYLRRAGAFHSSWEGNRVALPEAWPDCREETLRTPFAYRQYLNVCAFGYTTVWWDWPRWEQEIDWMAIRGINMPTAMEGQEAVYLRLWQEMGMEEEEIRKHFSGPAFLAWHRMGNINEYGGPLPLHFIREKEALQKKILDRQRALGMKPVVPAFSGYVPLKLKEKFPEANIRQPEPWGDGFEPTCLLDPTDPLFIKTGKRFIELYREMYGDVDFYLADSFNEMKPPVTAAHKEEELAGYGEAVYSSIAQGDPGATWVMQGWLFGHDPAFWDTTSINAFLSRVPDDKMIIQDFGNDRYPDIWKQTNAYGGKQWTYGYVHNYGGSNPVYGDFSFYNRELTGLLQSDEKGNLAGYGVLPEGLHNNSVVYEYIYDLAWAERGIAWRDWIAQYTSARYGYTSENMLAAWQLLNESVFQTRYWTPRWWNRAAGAYLLFKRPTVHITDFEGHPGDAAKLGRALALFLDEAKANRQNTLLVHDLVEFSRHYLSLRADSLLIETVSAYKAGHTDAGDALAVKVFALAGKLDTLVGVQPLNNLSVWLHEAERYGADAEESAQYVRNARTQITVWGGTNLKDYASKSWQHMYKDFYVPRWKMFFSELRQATAAAKPFDEEAARARIKAWEEAWCRQQTIPGPVEVADPVERVAELMGMKSAIENEE